MDSQSEGSHSSHETVPHTHVDRTSDAVVYSGLIFVFSLILGMLPVYLSKSTKVKALFPFVTVLAAGIQLAMIIADLFPDMCGSHGSDSQMISPALVTGLSFLLLLVVDSIFLHGESHEHEHKHEEESHAHQCSHDHDHTHESIGACNTSAISNTSSKSKAILLLTAISIHSLLEGLGVKIGKEGPNSKFLGFLLHKILESFSIGTSIFKSTFGVTTKIMLVLMYSAFTPLGMLLKSPISSMVNGAEAYLIALCLGSLLFSVFVEMIPHSFHDSKSLKMKSVLITVGFILGYISVVLGHSHDHADHEHHHHHEHHH